MMQYLSGVEGELGKSKGKIKAKVKAVAAKAKNVAKKVVKVSATPVREAFKVLLDVNFLNFAVSFKKAMAKDPKKVYALWNKFGGKNGALDKAIARGVAHYNKHHKGKKVGCLSGTEDYDGELGVVVATAVATAAATATPLIIAAKGLLKSLLGNDGTAEASPDDTAVANAGAADFKQQVEEIHQEQKQDVAPVEEKPVEEEKPVAEKKFTTKTTVDSSPVDEPVVKKTVKPQHKVAPKAKVKAKKTAKPSDDEGYVWYKDKRVWIGTALGAAALAALIGVLNKRHGASTVRL